jgi:hypothetical protein
MEMLLYMLFSFGISLAWVCFLSLVVGQGLYRAQAPRRRAALTAFTAFLLACGISCVYQLTSDRSRAMARLGMDYFSIEPFFFYAAAALVDFLLLWRLFRRYWVSDDEYSDTFS